MNDQPDLSTLPARMRYAAKVLHEADVRHGAVYSWSSIPLEIAAKQWEAEDNKLPTRMRYAAEVVEEAARTDCHSHRANDSSNWKGDAREKAEREALVEELARELFDANKAEHGPLFTTSWGAARDTYMVMARAVIESGWKKERMTDSNKHAEREAEIDVDEPNEDRLDHVAALIAHNSALVEDVLDLLQHIFSPAPDVHGLTDGQSVRNAAGAGASNSAATQTSATTPPAADRPSGSELRAHSPEGRQTSSVEALTEQLARECGELGFACGGRGWSYFAEALIKSGWRKGSRGE